MPIRSIGPIRIAKFEMKRKKTKITWVHSADVPSAEPSPLKRSPTVPHQEPPRKSHAIVIRMTPQIVTLSQKRQNQVRRRATTSSSRSWALSEPKRLGHGIVRRKSRSTKPRNAITRANAASSAFHQGQPFCSWNQM